ncbi:hypothetical protein [Rhodococcus qingshengii]|uniref:hypothetical protein n=1 Tax=Rhodococcus qingshengii TaxID=334542 RepID=UPI0035DB0074
MVNKEAPHYEIETYSAEGEQLSTSSEPGDQWSLLAGSIWDVVSLVSLLPAHGWIHWDDGQSQQFLVGRIVIKHHDVRKNRRGGINATTNILETIHRERSS